jgi:hypothetical protein
MAAAGQQMVGWWGKRVLAVEESQPGGEQSCICTAAAGSKLFHTSDQGYRSPRHEAHPQVP